MDQSTIDRTIIAVDILAALTTHAWLKRYDPVPISRVVPVLAIIPLVAAWFQLNQRPFGIVLLGVLQSYAIYYATLSSSVIAYRLSPFHPLAQYPGPIILRVTKLYTVWVAYHGKNHIYLKSLHDQYGPVIRIGPNELSTSYKDLIPEVLGNQGMPKGPMWEGRRFAQTEAEVKRNYDSLLDVRRSDIHTQLRKPWNKSFTAEPLQNYERLLLPRVTQFNQYVKKYVTESSDGIGRVNMSKAIGYFSFDFMGDIAFGGAFELMRDGDIKGQHKAMEDGMYLPNITQHIPWLNDTLRSIPALMSGVKRLNALGVEQGIRRSTMEIKNKDLFHYMGESSGSVVPTLDTIIPNVILAIVAGSDTSTSVMTNAVQLVLSHPEARERLQKELDEAYNEHELPDLDFDGEIERYSDILAGLKVLNGVINEALRLFPAVPTALQRAPAKDSGGRLLQGEKKLNIFLPEGNAICVSPYVMHRDPRNFSPQPDDFIPERWFSDSYKTSRDAFIPFSYGPQNCVGRPLALIEMRYAVATLFRNFNLEFDTAKYDAVKWKNGVQDRFTFAHGALDVKATLRTRAMRGLK